MENKFSFIKERAIQIAEIKKISRKDFCKKIGMTTANFRGSAKETPLNSDTIENILSLFPDISPDWLILGNGPVFRSEVSNPTITEKNYLEIIKKLADTNQQLVQKILTPTQKAAINKSNK